MRPSTKDMTPRRGSQKVQDKDKILTREEAISEGLVLYWNGQNCERGHCSPRYTKSGHCKECYRLFRAEEIQQTEISKDKLKKVEKTEEA